MEQDLVDILVTTYNTNKKYLIEQIDSLINQTYKNIKIYISDDKSTNRNVLRTLEEYEKKDSRIIVFEQSKNLGYNKNFEFLLKQSKADYIMFCDHDDIWYKDKVEISLQKIKKENVDMVYCNARQINENKETLNENYFKYKNVPIINGKNNEMAISRCIGIGCSQMITKDVKKKMLPFTDKVIAHDWLAAFIANKGKGIVCIEDNLFDYRLHEKNVFGGRSLDQNLNIWKKEYGNSYKSFLEYRQDLIKRAYLGGAEMCLQYSKNEKDDKYIKRLIKYYEELKKSKFFNFHYLKYFEFLAGKNLAKKMVKEIVIFHFPLLAYLKFRF